MTKLPLVGNISRNDLPFIFISLIPLWWILGVDFIVFHILTLFYFFKCPFIFKINDFFQLFISLLIFLLLFSLLISNANIDRWFASLNNISIFIVGYFYYSYTKLYLIRNPITYQKRFFKYFFILSCVYIAAAILAAILYFIGFAQVSFTTGLGLLPFNLPGLLGEYQNAQLFKPNWFFFSTVPRLFIFSLFATGSALVIALSGYLGVNFINPKNYKARFIFLSLVFLCIVFTLSRTSIVAFLISFSLLILFYLGKSLSTYLLLIFICFSALIISFSSDLFSTLLDARAASTSARLMVYTQSIDFVLKNGIFLGLGIKPRLDDFFIPLGSHSTFISILVRGGSISFMLFSCAMTIIVFKIFRSAIRLIFLKSQINAYNTYFIFSLPPVLCALAYILLQDMDAYPSICVLIMTSVAYFSYYEKRFSASIPA